MTRSPSEGTPAASVEGTTPPSLRDAAEAIRAVNVRIAAFPPTERLDDMLGDRALAEIQFEKAATPAAILELLAERDQLRSALREAQEDAERFVWIRDHAQSGLVPSGEKTVHRWTFDLPYRTGVSTDWLREGIDSAAGSAT